MVEFGLATDTCLAVLRRLNDTEKMSSLRLRQSITGLSSVSLPVGFVIRGFVPECHARAARALLNDSYATGAGQVEAFDDWWSALQTDPEYASELCVVVEDAEVGALAGFAHCWTSAFLKDIVVAPLYRRRGLGRSMLQEISNRFVARGCSHLDLKVVPENVTAIRFYRSLGFQPVEA